MRASLLSMVAAPAAPAVDPRLLGMGWVLGGAVAVYLVLFAIGRRLDARSHPLGGPLRGLRHLVLPVATLWTVLRYFFAEHIPLTVLQIVGTLLGIAAIHVVLAILNAGLFRSAKGSTWRARTPGLLVDIVRFSIVLFAGLLVVQQVWTVDVGGLLTALGFGSLVLGLALQDTLGNLFAGIALLFERPFEVGDWVRVGETEGRVANMNWRAVRVITRDQDYISIPNSVLGKERIQNMSQPTRIHGTKLRVGFSYNDPPNKCKRVLLQCALATRGVVADPPPVVRTVSYADSAVDYDVRVFIDDYARKLEIQEELMTRVWYAARRNSLTIPFPIRTVYKIDLPPEPPRDAGARQVIQQLPVFVPLSPEELDALARDAMVQTFAKGERIVHQGEVGDSLYVIRDGSAVVSFRDENGLEREVARLQRGEFFGEMALLTGEPRTANVSAGDDLEVLVIYKEAVQALLARRPALAQEIAEIVEARRQGLRAVKEVKLLPPEKQAQVREGASLLLAKIKRFLGV